MHLLRSDTLDLEEFSDADIPPYAILSHTWTTGGEVTLPEIQEVNSHVQSFGYTQQGFGGLNEMRSIQITDKSGYDKITRCCETARKDGFQYVWVDTCCIDKTSSVELSEAINSMYRWYQRAEVCYVYLSDVVLGPDEGDPNLEQPGPTRTAFMSSRWFTRGWTLQELIGPRSVIFFNQKWQELGTKTSLKEAISEVTRIQVEVLLGMHVQSYSIAQRMSWASKRQTTRLEDATYCLMGLFDVNMPMLYGEGHKAFIRFQEEIIRNSSDDSILAWSDDESSGSYHRGVLAHSPAAFSNSGNIIRSDCFPMPIKLTSKGVHILVEPVLRRTRVHGPVSASHYRSVLGCVDSEKLDQLIAICLKNVAGDTFSKDCDMRVDRGRRWETVTKPEIRKQYDKAQAWQKNQKDAYVPQNQVSNALDPLIPYENVYVELKSHVAYLEVYPSIPEARIQKNCSHLGDHALSMMPLISNDSAVAGIRLPAGSGENEDFVVLLERQGRAYGSLLSAEVLILPTNESLDNAVLTFVTKILYVNPQRNRNSASDRVMLQHKHRRISVLIKRKMVAQQRRLVVEITSIDLPVN